MTAVARLDVFAIGPPEPHDSGTRRYVTLVRAEDADGAVGWGEAISLYRPVTAATKLLAEEGFAPLVVGKDAGDVEAIWTELRRHSHRWGPEGIAGFAISAIDMALWDLKGRQLGQPVARLLGGALRERIPAMASIHFDMEDLEWTLNEFRGFREDGYRIVKAGWGMRPDAVFGQDRERDLRFIEEIREVIGPEISLVADLPGARGIWDVPTAIRRVRELDQFDLRWIEQPLPPADLAGHRRLREAVLTPIGTGEDEWRASGYRRLVESGGVDVLQLDPGRCLGITGCRRIGALIEAANLSCSAHSWSSALNTAASLHFLATTPAADTLDFKPHESPLQHELVEDPWIQEDGYLALRAAPGLGVTVREDVVAAMAREF